MNRYRVCCYHGAVPCWGPGRPDDVFRYSNRQYALELARTILPRYSFVMVWDARTRCALTLTFRPTGVLRKGARLWACFLFQDVRMRQAQRLANRLGLRALFDPRR